MKKICLVAFIVMMLRFGLCSQTVTFSHSGGFYENSFSLELACDEAYHIRYTINGGTPTASSPLYTNPLALNESLYSNSDIYTITTTIDELLYIPNSVKKCIIIRACAFDNDENRVGEVTTQSYFINELGCDTHGLPAMSIAADSSDLFDYYTGIFVPGVNFDPSHDYWSGNYYMSGDEWERVVNIEFYEPADNSGVNQTAGIRTHGGTARRGPQKGMKLYARQEYGTKRFYHKFFDDSPKNSVKHLVLKPFSCQWFSTGIQDWICNNMAKSIGLEYIASRPEALFINGEYWGIYYVSERPDSHYLEDHFGHGDDDYNVIGSWHGEAEDGENANFIQMMQWLEDADLADSTNYEYLCSLIDVDNFINYYCLELFIANNDWPANNMRCYQYQDGKWRWIFFDGDDCLKKMSFDVFGNATCEQNLGWPTDAISTLMFRRLLENEDFRSAFYTRFEHLLNNQFDYEATKPYLTYAKSIVIDEIQQQAARFNRPKNLSSWKSSIDDIDNFLRDRCDNMRERIDEFFVSIEENQSIAASIFPNPTYGTIHINLPENQFHTIKIQIFSIVGTLVCERYATTSLDIDMPAGIYLIKIGNSTQRIVVI